MKRATFAFLTLLLVSCGKDENNSDDNATDIDGNIYSTVEIGTQIWLVENLKTTKFNDGTNIPNVTDAVEWNDLTTPAFSWYENDPTQADPYGALYNWHTVATDKICMTGWHVPSSDEWATLVDYLGGEEIAGIKLKEEGSEHWTLVAQVTDQVTNESGFSGLPGGGNYGLDEAGQFLNRGSWGYHWGRNENESGNPSSFRLAFNNQRALNSYAGSKTWGHSIRCLKD